MKQKNLWIMCGPPASGKSTFIREFFKDKDSWVVVSRDKIRFALIDANPTNDYFGNENDVFKQYVQCIKEDFAEYDNVIADATHLNERSRNKLLNSIGSDFLANININCIVMMTPVEICIERNKNREGLANVPEGAIRRMAETFKAPTYNEKYKYNNIYTVNVL